MVMQLNAEALFQQAQEDNPNSNAGRAKLFGKVVRKPQGELLYTAIDQERGEVQIYEDSPRQDMVLLLKFMLLEDLGDKATAADQEQNVKDMEELFSHCQALSNARNVPLPLVLTQTIILAVVEERFNVSAAKNKRNGNDNLPTSPDNKKLIALLGKDLFTWVNLLAKTEGKSNRSAFIAGIRSLNIKEALRKGASI